MLIKDVMTRTPTFCRPDDTLDAVARLMLEHECGEIPVCDGLNIVGVITDRDITCRAVAKRKEPPETKVSEVMTHNVFSVRETDKVSVAIELFEDTLVRRLPVINQDGYLVGILSQADLAAKMPSFRIAHALKTVARKTRRQLIAVMVVLLALAPAAFGQRPQRDSGRTMHRGNERITVEGRVRTIHRERDGYRVELDRNDESFFVPESALRNRSRDFRIGISLRFAGIFRNGIIVVDAVDWPPFQPRREHRYADVLRGFVERVHHRSASLRVREERSGRLIDVDVRAPYAVSEVRPGDYITLTGEWTDRNEFTATHINAVRPRHR